jgi:hypothetical protein
MCVQDALAAGEGSHYYADSAIPTSDYVPYEGYVASPVPYEAMADGPVEGTYA